MIKTKITEIKETYTVKSRIRGDGVAADGSKFEYKTLTRYKEVVTVTDGHGSGILCWIGYFFIFLVY